MSMKPGARLRSQVDATEIIVVRPGGDGQLSCGGHPMIDIAAEPAEGLTAVDDAGDGTQLGKRYTSPNDESLEVLVTKPGQTGLALDGTSLVLKEAKPLPSSD